MIAERKGSGSCLPEDLRLGEQLLSTAGSGGELKVRALLLGVFILVAADDKHMFKPTFPKQFTESGGEKSKESIFNPLFSPDFREEKAFGAKFQ